MKRRVLAFLIPALGISMPAIAQPPAQNPPAVDLNAYYQIGPDSLAQEGVPKARSRAPSRFPVMSIPALNIPIGSTYRRNTILLGSGQPDDLSGRPGLQEPGGRTRAFNVMDNLIYRREIPVMIGVFINPGRTPDQPEPSRGMGRPNHQSATEYNTLNDKYPRVIAEELLPCCTRSTTFRRIRNTMASAGPVPARSLRSP